MLWMQYGGCEAMDLVKGYRFGGCDGDQCGQFIISLQRFLLTNSRVHALP